MGIDAEPRLLVERRRTNPDTETLGASTCLLLHVYHDCITGFAIDGQYDIDGSQTAVKVVDVQCDAGPRRGFGEGSEIRSLSSRFHNL